MKTLDCSLGARAAVLCAVASLAVAAPASADETAYLMYLKGSEGHRRADARPLGRARRRQRPRHHRSRRRNTSRRSTKLGLPRVLEYDAKLDKSQFAVRDPEFVRFVKVVATSIVQGFLTASPVPGAWAQPAEVKVHTATLLITPARERLEVTARLYVTYLDPQKSGPPKVQDLIKGDIVFVGQPEPAGPAEVGPPSKP